MQGAQITVTGYLGSDIEVREVNGQATATARVGETPSRFDRQRNEWVDLPTSWWTVNLWGDLATNAAASLKRGTAVIVLGNLTTSEWNDRQSGEKRTALELRASAIGPDLSRATAVVTKTTRRAEQAGATH